MTAQERNHAQILIIIDWLRHSYDRLHMQNSLMPSTRQSQRLGRLRADIKRWERQI